MCDLVKLSLRVHLSHVCPTASPDFRDGVSILPDLDMGLLTGRAPRFLGMLPSGIPFLNV